MGTESFGARIFERFQSTVNEVRDLAIKHPKTLEDITAQWMSWALHEGGLCGNCSVLTIELTSIGGGGVGFLSGVARVMLSYDREAPDLPGSVVVKLPAASEANREVGDAHNVYEREVRFYQEVAPHSPLRVPRCYFSVRDPENGDYILIMEDVSGYTFGDQIKGLTPEQAHAAIHTIAPFHARWWNHPGLSDFTWMPAENLDILHLFAQNWPEFRHQFYNQMTEAERAIGDRLNWQGDRLAELNAQAPCTIAHYDFRADNLIFDEASREDPVIVLDWQLSQRNSGAFDVARLVCGSVPSETQTGRHREFVHAWHERLLTHGVRNYSQDHAWRDYQTALLSCLYIPVAFHHFISSEGGRGLKLARAIMHRVFAAAVECDAAAVLDG